MTGEIVAPVTRSRLVRYVKTFSEHRYARWVLAAIAFADSSFLPIPPDLLLVPMALVRPKQIWALSLICTVEIASCIDLIDPTSESVGSRVANHFPNGIDHWAGLTARCSRRRSPARSR